MCKSVSLPYDRWATPDGVTAAIVSAMATIENTDQNDLDLCLGESLDADALESLFAHEGPDGSDVAISFTVDDYCVSVSAPGDLVVTRRCGDTNCTSSRGS